MKVLLLSALCLLAATTATGKAIKNEELCVCNAMYQPTCGSDGVTYGNQCMLNCATKTNPDLEAIFDGPCEDKQNQQVVHCKCPKMYKPVCGSNGKTYNTLCELNCEARTNPDLVFEQDGVCPTSNNQQTEEGCACPDIYRPVCGSDGVTYPAICELHCEAKHNPSLDKLYDGECQSTQNKEEDICICTKEYMPVCGNDGVTYGNLCTFQCKAKNNPSLFKVFDGECQEMKQTKEEDICICTREYMPVCGNDGVTYGNLCEFQCKAKNHPSLFKVFDGECQEMQQNQEEDICICTMEYMPVCGNDGVTYGNLCELKCNTKNQPSLFKVFDGECQEMKQNKEEDICICTREYMPVCGNDGVTYGNLCEFQCKAKNHPSLFKVFDGECQEMQQNQEEDICICTMEYMPVCGNDGVTYGNLCELKCNTKNQPSLFKVFDGECQEMKQNKEEDICICTREYMPVCGSDGKTYGNLCELDCEAKNNPDLKPEQDGECEATKQHEEICICPANYMPVCGNDGVTYGNFCDLNCQAKKNPDLQMEKEGEC